MLTSNSGRRGKKTREFHKTRHGSGRLRGRQLPLSDTALHRAHPSCPNTLDFPVAGQNMVLQAEPPHRPSADLGQFLESLGSF